MHIGKIFELLFLVVNPYTVSLYQTTELMELDNKDPLLFETEIRQITKPFMDRLSVGMIRIYCVVQIGCHISSSISSIVQKYSFTNLTYLESSLRKSDVCLSMKTHRLYLELVMCKNCLNVASMRRVLMMNNYVFLYHI